MERDQYLLKASHSMPKHVKHQTNNF